MEQEGENATVHGEMVEVSLIKPSSKHLGISGRIADGRKTAHVMSRSETEITGREKGSSSSQLQHQSRKVQP